MSTLKPIAIDPQKQREALRTLLEKGKLYLNSRFMGGCFS